ncbi:MAG: hypothetical protein RR334_00645 [Clostridia bacterium]
MSNDLKKFDECLSAREAFNNIILFETYFMMLSEEERDIISDIKFTDADYKELVNGLPALIDSDVEKIKNGEFTILEIENFLDLFGEYLDLYEFDVCKQILIQKRAEVAEKQKMTNIKHKQNDENDEEFERV